jgi:hypothetical protein
MGSIILVVAVALVMIGAFQASRGGLAKGLGLVGTAFGMFLGTLYIGFDPSKGLAEYLVILLPLCIVGWFVGKLGGEAAARGRQKA